MRCKQVIVLAIAAMTAIALSTPSWALRTMVQGQVIDAETGQPVPGAIVMIDWMRKSLVPGIGYRSGVEHVEVASDGNGYFMIPNHHGFIYEYILTIYKKGYVCWDKDSIFPSDKERQGFVLRDGVKILMERFKPEYSVVEHAHFTVGSSGVRTEDGLFHRATKEEERIHYDDMRQKEQLMRGKSGGK
jgi:hypothetical protein